MENILLFGSDYDGTFRRKGEYPEKEDMDAVRMLRRRGHIFGVVTGRTPTELTFMIERFGDLCDFLLCATGGVCLLPDRSIIFTSEVGGEDLPELYRICREVGAHHCHSDAMSLRAGYGTVEAVAKAHPVTDEGEDFYINGYVDSVSQSVRVSAEGIGAVEKFTQFTAYFDGEEPTRRAIGRIEEAFPGKYKCHFLGNGFDMTPAGVSKTLGLSRVAAHFGIACENIYTAGDGWNDVDMLRAYHGIAMKGSARGIIDSAEYVFDSVGEAVYKLILDAE